MNNTTKMALLPMWVIDRIKEEMRLGPAAWQAITDAVEQAEVPQALPCEVKLPPGTVISQGTAVSTLILAIQQRASQPAHAQVFSSSEPEQSHPEPIAWMVGTAFWWTKEEAERDAAAMGLPVVTLGPCAGRGDHERLRTELVESDLAFVRAATEAEQLRAQLAERDALLRELLADDVPLRLAAKIETALPASAEPSATAKLIPDGYCLMPRRLTAENGAKALLLGEFKLEVTRECPECLELDEPAEGCEICDGEGEYAQRHTIPWDQIKFIYSEAVKGLAFKPNTAR